MNERQVPEPSQVAAPPPPSTRADPLRRWTLIVLVLAVLLFGWTLIADRLTPYTGDASVRTFVVRIVPEVSGKIIEVAVEDNQVVRTGDLLYRTPRPVLDRALDIAVLSLYTIGATGLLLPPPRPRRPTATSNNSRLRRAVQYPAI